MANKVTISNVKLATASVVFSLLFFFVVFAGQVLGQFSNGGKIVYSYFIDDPVTSIHINWISASTTDTELYLRRRGSTQWNKRTITRQAEIPGSDYILFEVKLTGLRQDTAYDFRIGQSTDVMRFRTLPEFLSRPINFVNGGDLYGRSSYMIPTTIAAASVNPYFVVVGGDWAYADGDPEKVSRWFRLFEIWQEHMITNEGYMVPFVPAIGNHEVVGAYYQTYEQAPLYFTFFDKPDKRAYFTLDIGNYLSLILLDSNHTNLVGGQQALWLEEQLSNRQHIPNVFPAYHVPAWPSFRALDSYHSTRVRDTWVPLFEYYGITLAFENHDHTFKRTKPIRNNEVNEDGVIYIGDGSWGVGTRRADDAHNRWYIEKVTDDHHYWNITLMPGLRIVEAFNERNIQIDRFEQIVDETDLGDLPFFSKTPTGLELAQNYPNPFNPSTMISFYIPEAASERNARLDLFNLKGQRIYTLINQPLRNGPHFYVFDTRNYQLPSGHYLYRLQIGNEIKTRQMQLIK